MKLFKKSLMLIASFGLFLSGALAINIQKEVKQAGATTEVTVHSNFASNVTDPDTAGFLNSNGSKKYLAVDSGTDGANLSSSNLFLFLGSQKDSNVSLTFKGNQTNYPKGNCVSNTGVLALKYGSTEKGGEFVIETSDVDKYIITSVSVFRCKKC